MDVFAGFVCAILAITLVGHGIWVFFAALFRMAAPPPIPERPAPPRRPRRDECPGCSAPLWTNVWDCPNCGLDLDGPTARRLDRVRTAQAEIRELIEQDALDQETADRVLNRLAERARELHTAPAPRAEPRPPVARLITPPTEPPPLATPVPAEAVAPAPAPSEPEPRRGVLVAFMEERNILWGELVGGLLIVGCSIALVLTLWRSLEALPYFPFLLSAAITAAVFAAGQYTLHHWKLASTSRGLLVIALLLTPLNLLLLANPVTEVGNEWLDAGVKAAAVLGFVGLVRAAGRDLIGTALLPGPVDRRWLLALAVVGAPVSLAFLPRDSGWLPAWVPLLCHLVACLLVLAGLAWYRGRGEAESFPGPRGVAALTFVGLSAFALFAAWGLVLTRAGDVPAALVGLAVPLALAGVPVIEVGLLTHRRAAGVPGVRATGTGVAAAGAVLLVAAVSLAWPDPAALALVAALVGLVFTREAWREAAPWFQAGALPAFGLALVLGVHGLLGGWTVPAGVSPAAWLQSLLGSTTSGGTLVGYALLLALAVEVIVRLGHRQQAVAHAVGGLAAGALGLFLVWLRGVEEPWPAVAACAAGAVGLLTANARWRQRAPAEAGVWLILVGTFWALWAVIPNDRPTWGLTLGLESLTLAAAARLLGGDGRLRGQYRGAAADVAVAAGVAALALSATETWFPPGNNLLTATVFAVAASAFLLSAVFRHPWPTWAGSVLTLVGLVHGTVFTLGWRPVSRPVLVSLLGHATLATITAVACRSLQSARLYGDPLRRTALGSSVLAVPFLLYPLAGFVPEWVGFAGWLAALWFGFAWQWRDRALFSAGQAAVVWAATLAAFVWVERHAWWATTSLGFADPRVLQAVGVALAALALVWTVVRRVAERGDGLLRLWLRHPLALDRVVTACAIVATLGLLVISVVPGVQAEWTPIGGTPPVPPAAEHAHSFGLGTWAVLGLFAAALIAGIRFSTDVEPDHDAPVLGLAVLAISAAVAAAGTFAAELATASALRWGLAAVFLAGTAVLVFRDSITRSLSRFGFPLRVTPAARWGGYALFAGVAAAVVGLTIPIAAMGLTGQTPSGPAESSVFARMGWSASALVPLALVVVGLTASGWRERSAGYLFAAGGVFTGTVVGGYALAVVTAGGTLGPTEQLRLGIFAAASAAAWSLLWQTLLRRVPGGPLLAAQTLFGLVGVALLAVGPLVRLFAAPNVPLPEPFVELGRIGWVALALAGWAGLLYAARRLPPAREHVVGVVAVLAGVFAACSVVTWDEPGRSVSFYTMAAVWAAAGVALTATVGGPWLVVLAVGVAAAGAFGPTPAVGRWPVPLALAAYALTTALVGRRVRTRREWVVAGFAVVGVTATALAIVVTLGRGELAERLTGPLAVGLLAIGLGVLDRRVWSAVAVAVALVLLGWAAPDPDSPALWLQRNAWAFVALVAATTVGLEVLPRLLRSADWSAAVRRVAGGLFPIALAALVVVLLQQVPVFDPVTRQTPLTLTAVLAVLGGITAFIVLLFRFAVAPGADPYHLSASRRSGYVYLAELVLVLFFVHVRFNLPELFRGQAVRYWTFLVMLLAFVWVGLADLFERRGPRVLARPMRRTGVLLPLVPLVAFWAKPPGGVLAFADAHAPGVRPFLGYLEKLPQHFDAYAWLWFLAGTLYGLVALSRRSFGWAILAALAANAGLWSLFAHTGVSALVHPQVWVIPLALIVLVSEHVNRRHLRPDVSAGLRYLGVGMVYVSSTADLFIAGVGQTWWLPLVLAVLCLAGMLAGIVLRVRAFLFLGVGFLTLDVFAMIWHAAVDRSQTWVWYASGILLGAVILALFALFEKRRNDVLAVVDRVRGWD